MRYAATMQNARKRGYAMRRKRSDVRKVRDPDAARARAEVRSREDDVMR